MTNTTDIIPSEHEQIVRRNLKLRAADCIMDKKTEIIMDRAEFRTAILFEQIQLYAPALGKPVIAIYHGMQVVFNTSKSN